MDTGLIKYNNSLHKIFKMAFLDRGSNTVFITMRGLNESQTVPGVLIDNIYIHFDSNVTQHLKYRALFQYSIRHLIVRSREVSKP